MDLTEKFFSIYGRGNVPRVFAASGRVNIIGEHIDYNGGSVFPAAIGLGCFICARENGADKMNIAFEITDRQGAKIDKQEVIDYNNLDSLKRTHYINYQAGVCDILSKAGVSLTGLDVLYDITVPFGSGLSSSAAIEVATAYMLCKYADKKNGTAFASDLVTIAKWAQRAENIYVGVNCGIMDQFAAANGRKDKAILLDCASLAYEYVDFDLKDYALVIINTNRPHNLVKSKYNERRAECVEALEELRKAKPGLINLCSLTPEEFEGVKSVLNGKILERAEHCVYEQARVLRSARAMREGDIAGLGAQLYASHESLKSLYKVSCLELDTIVEFAKNYGGACSGARMTGAGFGGSAIAIVRKDKVADFSERLREEYRQKTGISCVIYNTWIEDGAREIKI